MAKQFREIVHLLTSEVIDEEQSKTQLINKREKKQRR